MTIAGVLEGRARWHVEHGQCIGTDSRPEWGAHDVLRSMPDACVDAIVTDNPYELGFMGKRWDASGIAYNVDMWRVIAACGHSVTVLGTRLRQADKMGAVVRCAQCRPKRPGTVQRKQVERSWDPRPLWVRALEARGQEVRFNV